LEEVQLPCCDHDAVRTKIPFQSIANFVTASPVLVISTLLKQGALFDNERFFKSLEFFHKAYCCLFPVVLDMIRWRGGYAALALGISSIRVF
jgi:hypothetical protein